ncbi:hypothetical protein BYT27DRAFT_7265412 [Phlegmacium glaucopus]|nr:hypothetical protein BYT27DRAFT_7265412 [Phlegmacium glaucopus]
MSSSPRSSHNYHPIFRLSPAPGTPLSQLISQYLDRKPQLTILHTPLPPGYANRWFKDLQGPQVSRYGRNNRYLLAYILRSRRFFKTKWLDETYIARYRMKLQTMVDSVPAELQPFNLDSLRRWHLSKPGRFHPRGMPPHVLKRPR